MTRSNGVVFYRGKSQIDNRTPIVGIMTGIKRASTNLKTGAMLQTWIIRERVNPHYAAQTGRDGAICGDCPLAKLVNSKGERIRARKCYVQTEQAPSAIYNGLKRGIYSLVEQSELGEIVNGRSVRIGAYGDPCAIPVEYWEALLVNAKAHTGYTHQWGQERFSCFRSLIMASCETEQQHRLATSRGWRTFSTGSELVNNQIICPNTTHGVSCIECRLCDGKKTRTDSRKNIVIQPHGGRAIMSAWNKS